MKEQLIIVGNGSASSEVIDFIERYDLFDIIGYAINAQYITENEFRGKPLYPLEELDQIIDKTQTKLFLAISWYQNMNGLKRRMFEELKASGFRFANLVSPSADVFTQDIGEGNWICDHAYLSHGCKIGDNNTFRPYAFVGHYSDIKNHSIIGARSNLAGHVTVGNQVYIGIGATIFNKIEVGEKCLVGGSAIVKRHLAPYSLVVVPDCIVKQKDSESIEKYLSLGHIKKTIGDKPAQE
ncbi:MAG: hypothetical protein IJK64_04650 [Clostridia bacterium]|nr:hypothetical protein [Clostridia bacterium]